MRDKIYQARYKTGKRGIVASIFFVIIAALVLCICLISGYAEMLPVSVVLLFASLGCSFIFLKGYRELLLYNDRLEVIGIMSGLIRVIYYTDISKIGFARGETTYSYGKKLSVRYTDTVEIEELVILLKNGGKFQLGDDDYNHLPEVCAFIQNRIALIK